MCLPKEIIGIEMFVPSVATSNIACPHLDSEVERVTVKVKHFVREINIYTRTGLETHTV